MRHFVWSAGRGAPCTYLGVDYVQYRTPDGGDLYLTRFGQPLRELLHPHNWFAPEWFGEHRNRLLGTSVIYRVPTKPVQGRSLNLVVRFSRVGEEVPGQTLTLTESGNAEFNCPFEEFALVMQLRAASRRPGCPHIFTKKPLAIFSPAERLLAWQTGRWESTLAAKLARHPEVPLDFQRQYILLYGWIRGQDAVQTAEALGLVGDRRDAFLRDLTRRAIQELAQLGFRMLDIKPQHIVLRFDPQGRLLRRRDGQLAYALVDYELLQRTVEADETAP